MEPPNNISFELKRLPVGLLFLHSDAPFRARVEMRAARSASWKPAPILRQMNRPTWALPPWPKLKERVSAKQLREGELVYVRHGQSTASAMEHHSEENVVSYGRSLSVEPVPRFLRVAVEGSAPVSVVFQGGRVPDEDDAPAPRPDTPEFDPSPFEGSGDTAGLLAGPFSSAVARSLVETPDERTLQGEYQGEWAPDSTGHPIRVEELHGQYSGRVTLRVQAYGEPDPTAVDAEMGWAMLQEMQMEEVWLHAFLLAHASAPGRRGDREVIRIPRTQIEQLPMGFRSRNRSKWKRAEKIKEHVDRLRSVFVQFQNVQRHGDKLHFRHDMTSTPLWGLRMVAEGEKDLFSGEDWSEWYLEAREGMWTEEFLHNHGDQWAPLPKEWFKHIDRRGSDWGQRLAVLLLFLFRTNRKRGGRVELSAAKMLQACGVDLSTERSSSDRYDLKQKLSSALDDLHHNYGMNVQDDDVNLAKIDGRSYWTTWKNQTAIIDPPDKVDRALLSGDTPQRAPLPDTRPGRWGKKQIERLLNELGWTQKRLAERLPVGKQSLSHYLNDRRTPSKDVRAALDRIKARHL